MDENWETAIMAIVIVIISFVAGSMVGSCNKQPVEAAPPREVRIIDLRLVISIGETNQVREGEE